MPNLASNFYESITIGIRTKLDYINPHFQSTSFSAHRERVDSSSSRALLIPSASTPDHSALLSKNGDKPSSRRTSMPTDTVDNSLQPIQITEEISIKSSSSSSMSNKSSLSSASTSLKGDNVSL